MPLNPHITTEDSSLSDGFGSIPVHFDPLSTPSQATNTTQTFDLARAVEGLGPTTADTMACFILRRSNGETIQFPTASLADYDFGGADLSRIVFNETNLRGANLSGCDLTNSVFTRCSLLFTDFRGANMCGVRILDSNATGANFNGANLASTLFREVILEGASTIATFDPATDFDNSTLSHDPTLINRIRDASRNDVWQSQARAINPSEQMARMYGQQRAVAEQDLYPGSYYGTDIGSSPAKKKEFKPRTYRFGLEFEAYKPKGKKLKFDNVHFGTDGSIKPPDGYRGFEFRTKDPMKFQDMQKHVKKLLPYINENGCDVNKTCGLHIHTSHPRFFKASYIKKLLLFWVGIEDVIMSTQPKSRLNNFYCKRSLFQYINDYGQTIPKAKEMLIHDMAQKDRYSALNLASLGKHGTIEIRLHAGTLSVEKITNWNILVKAIFDYVKDRYNPITARMLFNQDISVDKIEKVFKLLKLPEDVSEFYLTRIEKFGWRRLRAQTRIAKECIVIQKEKEAAQKVIERVDKKLKSRIKKLGGKTPVPSGGGPSVVGRITEAIDSEDGDGVIASSTYGGGAGSPGEGGGGGGIGAGTAMSLGSEPNFVSIVRAPALMGVTS